MREKLAIAKKIRNSRKNFSNDIEYKKMCSKCYRTYIVECIIKGKDEFKVVFGGKYIQSFPKRVSDWYYYILNSIYRFYLVHVTPNDDKTFQKYELIHYGVHKPFHVKIANTPNELILESFLKKNGFKIVEEHFYNTYTVYDVARI